MDCRQVKEEDTEHVTDEMREGGVRMIWAVGLGSWVDGGAFL